MTAVETVVRCDYCTADVTASETYEPYRGAVRCRDLAACERRQLRAFDPTIPPDEDRPRPLGPQAVPPGTACAACGASSSVADLYQRGPSSSTWFCLDRGACDFRAATDMTPVREDFTDFVITPAQMRASHAAAGAVVPDIAALARADVFGAKRST